MSALTRRIRYTLWTLGSHAGRPVSCGASAQATVLIACYSQERARNLGPQVRHLLKCTFVERIVLSNHNPDLRLPADLPDDPRVVVVAQPVSRGCGFRWFVAQSFNPDYLIVIDDDILLYPRQIAALFDHLVTEPDVPHGMTGMSEVADTEFVFVERDEMEVDFLCEVYAVTGEHLRRYRALRMRLEEVEHMGDLIDRAGDFAVVSQTGNGPPRIHDVGRIQRCETFDRVGVAVHKDEAFAETVHEVSQALKRVRERECPSEPPVRGPAGPIGRRLPLAAARIRAAH